jgi:hypothetical protein
MPSTAAIADVCFRCGAPISDGTVSLTESEATTDAVRGWVVCSWDCAAELAARMARRRRDD